MKLSEWVGFLHKESAIFNIWLVSELDYVLSKQCGFDRI